MARRDRVIALATCFAALGALLTGAVPAAAQLRLTPSLSVAETFSDNVDRDPDGEEVEAFITDVTPRVGLSWAGARVQSTLDLAATTRYQTAGEDEGVTLLPDAAGFGTAEISEDLLFFDTSGTASTELLNTRSEDTEANRGIVQTYSASPHMVGHFGGFADGRLRYTYDQVLGEEGGTSDSVSDQSTHSLSAGLSSGSDFSRILWGVSVSASESDRGDESSVSRRDATLDLEYVVDRSLSVLGSAGYQQFDDGDAGNDVDDPTWSVGARWRPGPRTDITLTYGQRDGEQSFAGDLTHRIGPRTTLRASYTEALQTGQERLVQDLSFIGADPDTGALIDTRTGLPFNPNTSGTTIDDDTQRTRTFSLALSGTRGRNNFSLSGQVQMTQDESSIGPGDDEDAYSLAAGWSRRLSPRANLGLSASVARNEFERDGRTDDEIEVGASYSYNIFRNINGFARYGFGLQQSDDPDDEFIENRVTLGVSASF